MCFQRNLTVNPALVLILNRNTIVWYGFVGDDVWVGINSLLFPLHVKCICEWQERLIVAKECWVFCITSSSPFPPQNTPIGNCVLPFPDKWKLYVLQFPDDWKLCVAIPGQLEIVCVAIPGKVEIVCAAIPGQLEFKCCHSGQLEIVCVAIFGELGIMCCYSQTTGNCICCHPRRIGNCVLPFPDNWKLYVLLFPDNWK